MNKALKIKIYTDILKQDLKSYQLTKNKVSNKNKKIILKSSALLLSLVVITSVLVKNNSNSASQEANILSNDYITENDYDNIYILFDENNKFITIAKYKQGVTGVLNLVDMNTGVTYYPKGYNPLRNNNNYTKKISLEDYLNNHDEYKYSFTKEEFNNLKKQIENNYKVKVKEYKK